MADTIPKIANRTTLVPSIQSFLKCNPSLHLGDTEPFTSERAHHLRVFGIHSTPPEKVHPISSVEFTALRGPHEAIPIRVLFPSSGEEAQKSGNAAALVYFMAAGTRLETTERAVKQEENEEKWPTPRTQFYVVEYRLAPKHKFPTQLEEYSTVIDALQSSFGSSRGVHPSRVLGGGDSVGGNMTAAIALRRGDEGLQNLAGQFLLYLEARLPFDTPPAAENNSWYYLECNGVVSFVDNYLPRGVAPGYNYISPGMQEVEYLKGQSLVAVFTSGFNPFRDVGVEYASKLQEAGVQVRWRHYEGMTHGWLQTTAWSDEAVAAGRDVAEEMKWLIYEA